jgi:hypothetical protein|tara:strand:+ start:3639 stop:4181 length:543 start_codon:yes stop_codon:yes gene_type:complete
MTASDVEFSTRVFSDLTDAEQIKLHGLMTGNNDVSDELRLSLSDSFNIQRDPGLQANVTVASHGGDPIGMIIWGPSNRTRLLADNPSIADKITSAGFDPEKAYTSQVVIISEKHRGQGIGTRLSVSLRAAAVAMGYTTRLDFGYRSKSVKAFANTIRGNSAIDLDHTDAGGHAVSLFPLV